MQLKSVRDAKSVQYFFMEMVILAEDIDNKTLAAHIMKAFLLNIQTAARLNIQRLSNMTKKLPAPQKEPLDDAFVW